MSYAKMQLPVQAMQAEYSDLLPLAEIAAAPMHRGAIALRVAGWPWALWRAGGGAVITHPAGSADTAEAMRAAQRHVLSTRRAAGQSVHPFYRAGFVALGDWR